MIIYRITHSFYKDDLSGIGAKTYGGRWNSVGFPVLYTSEHISLCVVEMLVNINFSEAAHNFNLLQIHVPDSIKPAIVVCNKLKTTWVNEVDYTQFIGTEFLKNRQSLLLKVPSAVINEENNYLLNPLHDDFKKISIHKNQSFKFDNRLFTY